MRANKPQVVIAVLFVLLIALAIPAAASDVRIVRLSLVEGDVLIDRGTASGAEPALMNMPITTGTRLVSDDDDARVEIEFENGSTLRLAGAGEIIFRELSLTGNGSKVSLAEVPYGIVYANVTLQGDDDFRLEFNGENVSLRKSSRFRVDVNGPKSSVAVYKGEVQLQGHPGLVVVGKGETLDLDQDQQGEYELARGIDPYDTDSWDKSRNDYRNSYKNSDVYSYSGATYGGLYSYGLTDLANYGRYAFVPGYGYMWQPFGINAGWDPYYGGAWSYYPGSGWIFVSTSPWGWLPYRYGSWAWVDGFGWGWRPGSYTHWGSTPVVSGNPPTRFHPPAPPTTSAGPTTFVNGGRPPRRPAPPVVNSGVPAVAGPTVGGATPRVGRPTHGNRDNTDAMDRPIGGRPPRIGRGSTQAPVSDGTVSGATPSVAGTAMPAASGAPVGPAAPPASDARTMRPSRNIPSRPSLPPSVGDSGRTAPAHPTGGSPNIGGGQQHPAPSTPSPRVGGGGSGHAPSAPSAPSMGGGGHMGGGGGSAPSMGGGGSHSSGGGGAAPRSGPVGK